MLVQHALILATVSLSRVRRLLPRLLRWLLRWILLLRRRCIRHYARLVHVLLTGGGADKVSRNVP